MRAYRHGWRHRVQFEHRGPQPLLVGQSAWRGIEPERDRSASWRAWPEFAGAGIRCAEYLAAVAGCTALRRVATACSTRRRRFARSGDRGERARRYRDEGGARLRCGGQSACARWHPGRHGRSLRRVACEFACRAPDLLPGSGCGGGGEAGPVRSAGFCVYGRDVWPLAELRVDWSDEPIADLRALWQRYEPQMNDYATRAKRPEQAPAYGVPGDQ